MKRVVVLYVSMLLVSLVLNGCGAKEYPRLFWPAPPNEPKLEYIKTYQSAQNFPRTGLESFIDSLIGMPPARVLARPFGVAVHEDRLYISEPTQAMIRVYNRTARSDTSMVEKVGMLKMPMGLAVGLPENRIYVADAKHRKVLTFSLPDHQFVGVLEHPDGFRHPTHLSVDNRLERIYVTDSGNNRVHAFSKGGELLFSVPRKGSGVSLYRPSGTAAGPDGKLFVVDQLNFAIKVFDSEGEYLYSFGQQGSNISDFELARDIALDSDGHVYITDFRSGAVLVFEQDGTFLLRLGSNRTEVLVGFSTPTSIWIAPDDRIYVADQINRRVSVWQYLSAEYLERRPLQEADLEYMQTLIDEKTR